MGIFDTIFNSNTDGDKNSKEHDKKGQGSIKHVDKINGKKDCLGKGVSEVKLEKVGDKKIEIIKIIREYTRLGLKEAKDLADGVPNIVAENISSEGAESFGNALKIAGADVVVIGNKELSQKIKTLLIEQNKKLSCSDIDSFLLHQNLEEVKYVCEAMYRKGEISFAGNGRYFSPLNSNKKNTQNSESPKSSKPEIDIETELEKYKKLFDKGLITKEAYEAKMNKILDL